MYENVLLFSDPYITYGTTTQTSLHNDLGTANVARAVFLGAQAAVIGFGRNMDWPMRVKWIEEMLDAGNQLRVTAGMIWGVKKTVFNSKDFGAIVISTYAAN